MMVCLHANVKRSRKIMNLTRTCNFCHQHAWKFWRCVKCRDCGVFMHEKCMKRSVALADLVDINPTMSTVSVECRIDDEVVIIPVEQGETSSCEVPAFEPVDEDDNDDENDSTEVPLPRFVAPWPLANLTSVTVNCPWPGGADEEPATITVSHGHALECGHLDGRYAVVADRVFARQQSTSGQLPIVLVLRQPGGRLVNRLERTRVPRGTQVPEEPAFTGSAAGWGETATVTYGATTAFYAVDVPLFLASDTGSFAKLNVRLADGTLVATFNRRRRPDRREIPIAIEHVFAVGAGEGHGSDVRCSYRQRVSAEITIVDLLIVGPAVTFRSTVPLPPPAEPPARNPDRHRRRNND